MSDWNGRPWDDLSMLAAQERMWELADEFSTQKIYREREMSYFTSQLEFADKFCDLFREHAEWSQATFGSDKERGPLGPLRHLEKEAREAQTEAEKCTNLRDGWSHTKLREELADCFLLLLDASRRAGVKPTQLVEAAQAKLTVNKLREWPAQPPPDEAIEHVRGGAT